jgi:hypothetical protein
MRRSTILRTQAEQAMCAKCHTSRRCLVLTMADADTGGDAFHMRSGDTVAICRPCIDASMRHTAPTPHARTRFDKGTL